MYPEDPSDPLATRASSHAAAWSAHQQPSPTAARHVHHRGEDLDLTQLWGMVRDNAPLVFVIASIVFFLVMLKCLTSSMTFRSTARMYMGETSAVPSAASNSLDIGGANASDITSEIEVLRSRTMVRKAATAAGLNVSITPPGWKPPRFWHWLTSGRDPALLDPAADLVTATDASLNADVLDSRTYRIRFQNGSEYILSSHWGDVAGVLGEPLKFRELSITLLKGRRGPAAGSLLYLTVEPIDNTVERTLGHLNVTVAKGGASTEASRVLLLEFYDSNRRVARDFVTQLMHSYLEARHEWKTEDATAAEVFVTGQLKSLRASLDRTQAKLADYRAENRSVVAPNEAQSIVQQVGRYEEQRIAAQLDLTSLRDVKRAIQNPALPAESYMVGETHDLVLQRQAQSLFETRERLSRMSTMFNTAAPDVKQLETELKGQLAAIRSYVDGRISRAEKQLGALNQVIGEQETKLKAIPEAELELTQMSRESEVYSKMYTYLLERKQQAAITKASTVSKNRILDTAYVPLDEDSPKLFLHLASGFLGLLLGAAVVILRGLFSAVFRRENDVRNLIGPLQVFARIPTRSRGRREDGAPSPPIFDLMGSLDSSGFTEAFRSLRTNLYRALPGEHGKVVLITSPGVKDGKTTCALSLAAMLAADNRRVLVLDADVRSPSHHVLLDVPLEPGLRDVLQHARVSWRDAVRTLCLSAGSFDAISAGADASAELLSDSSFASFLVHARGQYDFVVIDGPSYPALSDPLVLAPLSDFVLSVVRLGSTSRRIAEEHLAGLMGVARGLALAVNNVDIAGVPANAQAGSRFGGNFLRLR